MIKIYTKTGDRGTTSLFGGEKVNKNSARIKAYGEVDELNSLIGVVLADLSVILRPKAEESKKILRGVYPETLRFAQSDSRRAQDDKLAEVAQKLTRIQGELFVLGADLATPLNVKVKIPRVTKPYIARLEKEIDKWSASLPQLKKFILPGGSKTGSKLHCARTVARRVERSIVDLAKQEKINKNVLIYTNRLSDWLFVLARYTNKSEGVSEISWKGRSKT